MTAEQRLFNEAWNHILAQGCPSVSDGNAVNTCQYRGVAGLGCAFAPAIENYNADMENHSAREVLEDFSNNLYAWVRNVSHAVACEIQDAHDEAESDVPRDEFMEVFKDGMRDVADRHNLTVPA